MAELLINMGTGNALSRNRRQTTTLTHAVLHMLSLGPMLKSFTFLIGAIYGKAINMKSRITQSIYCNWPTVLWTVVQIYVHIHFEHHCVPNHRELHCLFNSLFRITSTKWSKHHITGLLVEGSHHCPMGMHRISDVYCHISGLFYSSNNWDVIASCWFNSYE